MQTIKPSAFYRRIYSTLQVVIVLFVFLSCPINIIAQTKSQVYWSNALSNIRALCNITNGHARVASNLEQLDKITRLQADVVRHLKSDRSLVKLVRKSLRNDNRVWVRTFSAGMLIKAFKQKEVADCIYMLSDSSEDVRGLGNAAIQVYNMKGASASLASGLLSSNANERYNTLDGIGEFLRWKGIPYYSKLIYDTNIDVASDAARLFQYCKKEDADPLLLRYLRLYGNSHSKKAVVKRVIRSLCKLHGETVDTNVALYTTVTNWINKLEGQTNARVVPISGKRSP